LPCALREHRAIHDITVAHRCADGTERLIAWDAAPMPDASGKLLGAVAFGRDVTAEHRRHEREACLAAVTHAAAGASDSEGVEKRAARILTALVENTRTPVIAATLYLLDDEAGILRRVAAVGDQRSGTHAPAVPVTPQHPWWQLLIAGPVYSVRNGERPRWLRAIGLTTWKASSIRAWATVPLRTGGTLVGALAIGLSAPHVWDAAERTWLEACAAAISLAIENGRLLNTEGHRSWP
jgi:GAF domain-containing protein